MTFGHAVIALAVLFLCELNVGHPAHASPVAAGNNDTPDGSWQLTTFAPPFLVSNPVGPLENRAAVKFDLRDILAAGSTFLEAEFVVRGTVQTQKELSAYVFGAQLSGDVSAAELDLGELIGTVSLTPQPGVTEVAFDLTDWLTELQGSYPPFLGINLRESESAGGIVTLEYLIIGTILTLGVITGITLQQPVPNPAALVLVVIGVATIVLSRRRRM